MEPADGDRKSKTDLCNNDSSLIYITLTILLIMFIGSIAHYVIGFGAS
jgi:hypothetical protein